MGDLHIYRWNGSTTWSTTPSPTGAKLWGLFGRGPSDIWAVGEAGTLVHYNGTSWSTVTSGTTKNLYSVWSASATDVWAGGEKGTMLHGDAATFAPVASGTTSDVEAVWGTGASDVWSAGLGIFHWNGTSWGPTIATAANTYFYYSSISGSGPNDVWFARGDALIHWNGTALTVDQNLSSIVEPAAVWSSGVGTVWLVGSYAEVLHN